MAGKGTTGTEGLVEGSGTITDRDAKGHGGKAAWWQNSKPRWVQHQRAVGKHNRPKWILVTSKDWFLSWSANFAAARYSDYLDRNATADALSPAIIAAATALGMASAVALAPVLSSTAPIHCSPSTAAWHNTGLIPAATLRDTFPFV